VTITGAYPGTGEGAAQVTFVPRQELQRAGLALVNGQVYVAFSAHEDQLPFYGWMMGYTYKGTVFSQTAIINVAPNTRGPGIWMSGGAPAVDSKQQSLRNDRQRQLQCQQRQPAVQRLWRQSAATDPNSGSYAIFYAHAVHVQLAERFGLRRGTAVLADLPAAARNTVTHALICGGKGPHAVRDQSGCDGGYGDNFAVQELNFGGSIVGRPPIAVRPCSMPTMPRMSLRSCGRARSCSPARTTPVMP
jgi:hypothetical protein